MRFYNKIKKLKYRGVSLNVLFITGISLIFLLSVLSLAILASNGIVNMGKFASKISEKYIRSSASSLFLEKTRKKAEEYSNTFDEASDMADLLAVQLSTAWDNLQYYKFPDSFLLDYTDISQKKADAAISGVLKNNLRFSYWGDSSKLPPELQKKIFYFSNYFRLIEYIEDTSRYYLDCWISFKNDKYYMSYSDISENTYVKLPTKKTLNQFFRPDTIPRHGNWTDVYRDIGGKLVVSTFKNIIDNTGKTVGLAGLDIDIKNLLKKILKSNSSNRKEQRRKSSLNNELEPFSFVINGRDSKLIAFPNENYVYFGLPAQNIKDYDYRQELNIKLSDSKKSEIRKIAKIIQEKNEGFTTLKMEDKEYIVAFSKIAGNNWVFGVIYPVKLLFSSITEIRRELNKSGKYLTLKFILIGVFFLLLSAFLVTKFFNKYVLAPILELRKGVLKLGDGHFDTKLEETGVLEVKGLTRSFNKMKDELKNYMKELESEIVERKHLETEIEVAKKIQRSTLPRTSTIFLRDEFDLYGKLFSSGAIARDCYDFFYLKKNRIALLIADVSGKGKISAAFYMAVLKSTIRDICLQKSENPAKALDHVNRFLSDEYKVGMYVSLFLVYYDLDTGKMQYGNAGHYTALQMKKSGEYQRLGSFGNNLLGSISGASYKFEEKTLDIDDTLFLYTDGVIKATSKNGGYYGEDRLISFLLNKRELGSEMLSKSLFDDIKLFEGGNKSDDITMLIFKRKK